MATGLILVVEDEPTQRRAYVEALKARGFLVIGASNGEEASRLFLQYMPRLVILDVNLPGIGGTDVCRRIRRQHGRSATIIFITSNDRLEILHECIEAGGDDFLIKGVTINGVLERVSYWMHAPVRSLQQGQRDAILKNLRTAIHEDIPPRPASAQPATAQQASAPQSSAKSWRMLSPSTDEVVEGLTHFIRAARGQAPNGFGRTVDQKLFILGYIAGVVNFVANSSMMLKIRFIDYLKATLFWSGVLDSDDVDELVDSWHSFYGQAIFEDAGKRGELDYQSWKTDRQVPRSLSEFSSADPAAS
ncbi:MAG: response regulator [Alphaproteobacteria bacterium]|nr:response regulator [Alphaproteobacteria bacterium]